MFKLKYISLYFSLLYSLNFATFASHEIKEEYKTPIKSSIKPLKSLPITPEKYQLDVTNIKIEQYKEDIVHLLDVLTDERYVRPPFARLFKAILERHDVDRIATARRNADDVRVSPLLELPVFSGKQIKQSVAYAGRYLIEKEFMVQAQANELNTISYRRFRPFRAINNNEFDNLINRLGHLSLRNNEQGWEAIIFNDLKQKALNKLRDMQIADQLDHENDLEDLPIIRLHNEDLLTQNTGGLTAYYMIGSAIADGDCYFHAVFTREQQTGSLIKQEATRKRIHVIQAINNNEEYQNIIRTEMLGYYRDMKTRREYRRIPDTIRAKLDENDGHEITRNVMLERYNGNDTLLPPQYLNPILHSDEDIKRCINKELIQNYLQKYSPQEEKNVLNQTEEDEYFIPVPVGRNYPSTFSEIIAQENNIQVNFFQLDQTKRFLRYISSSGNNNDFASNILLEGRHFYPLYAIREGIIFGEDPQLNNFVQSKLNYTEDIIELMQQ